MRAAVAVTCALLLPSIRSGAQPTPTPVPPVPVPLPAADNMCTGVQAPEATFSIVVEQDNGTFVAVDRKLTNSVINGQDCACDAQDLFLQAFVIRGLPNGTQPTFSVWEGAGCEAPMARTSTCEQVNATVAPSDFWAGSANSAPRQRIDVRALLTPDPTASPGHPTEHTCPASNVGNAVFFLFGPTNAPSFCAVPIQVGAVPPTAAQEVSAVSGDGGVTLNWQSPPVGSALIPVSYQVLCADENGEPLPGEGAVSLGEPINDRHQLGYSTCIDAAAHVIERRVITTTGTTSTGQNGQTGQNGRRKNPPRLSRAPSCRSRRAPGDPGGDRDRSRRAARSQRGLRPPGEALRLLRHHGPPSGSSTRFASTTSTMESATSSPWSPSTRPAILRPPRS